MNATSIFISSDTLIATEDEAKKWMLENIKLNSINKFSSIIYSSVDKVTKAVYSLLHTISHSMIISAGDHSGIGKDSISEIIFPEACSFFIYPTSSEGITLGSISGMFETNLKLFLYGTLTNEEICAFDPVCADTQNGACLACLYLNEANCVHFNKDLSRLYLYGGTIKCDGGELIEIKKGFWK